MDGNAEMLDQLITKIRSKNIGKEKPLLDERSQAGKPLSSVIEHNLQAMQQIFEKCSDISFREFQLHSTKKIKAFIVYSDSLCKPEIINDAILKPIMLEVSARTENLHTKADLNTNTAVYTDTNLKTNVGDMPGIILQHLLTNYKADTLSLISEAADAVLEDNLVLIIDGYPIGIKASVQGYNIRQINEPTTEPNIHGPRDGFVENLGTNISLLRRRIRTSLLKAESITVGTLSKTKVNICYIQGVANEKIVAEVKSRIERITIDNILDSSYLEEFISDEPISLFPLVQYTERPDRTAASLFEGRIAIMVDNSPSALIIPCTFVTLIQASEDYYYSALFASFARLGRFMAINITLLVPAVTVAVFSVNQSLIPISLLNTVAGARENLPLPISLEIFLMELVFELLREAGVRLPRTVGQAISTVGGLVIGQAAVDAGIVSPTSVVVVGLTAVASFTFPDYNVGTSIRIIRFGLIIMASVFGIVGIIFGLMILLTHLCSLRSFGVPYLSPIAPLTLRDLKDTLIRAPWWAMSTRPRFFGGKKSLRGNVGHIKHKPKKRGDNK
ncbi:spore germination protein [Dehalobacter sp.]|uniref:spore germination protein n=2 Tax=Dehalobacter TaxID=56112 RepID=UPI002583E25B|nr:spore germination protein [Dehalobacter sp.]